MKTEKIPKYKPVLAGNMDKPHASVMEDSDGNYVFILDHLRLLADAETRNNELLEVLKEIFEEINLADHSMSLYKRTEQAIKTNES